MKKIITIMILLVVIQGCSNVKPLEDEQKNSSLHTTVRTRLPKQLKTTKDAINYYLDGTGYTIAIKQPAPKEAEEILNRKIIYWGNEEVLSIDKAILKIFDFDIKLIVDSKNKLVSVGYE